MCVCACAANSRLCAFGLSNAPEKKNNKKKKHRRKIIIECRYRIKMGIQGRHILLGHAHWEPLVTDLFF